MLRYTLLFFFSTFALFAQVDLNNATASDFLQLNGIGKAKSQKIVRYRESIQCFKSIDELATIDGISKKILQKNRKDLILGNCNISKNPDTQSLSSFKNVLLNPINIVFSFLILVLALLDLKTGKDFKSQIVSVGVLGTFVGIFIGLQAFNPDDIAKSVNEILVGLKTAFFTSIVGMGVSTLLAVIQKFKDNVEDEQ